MLHWIRQNWLWIVASVAFAGFLVVYVHMRTRRSRPGCKDVTGVECEIDRSPERRAE